MTKLHATLPKDHDSNGLDALNSTLIKDPEATHVLVVVVDCKQVLTDTDSGIEEATARVLRVEAVAVGDERVAYEMLDAALAKRTGKRTLPFEAGQ